MLTRKLAKIEALKRDIDLYRGAIWYSNEGSMHPATNVVIKDGPR